MEAERTSKGWSSSEIIALLNVRNAKILAFLLVLVLLGYHGVLKLWNGPDDCQWLMTKGRYQGSNIWQPYGCMVHQYSRSDVGRCFKNAKFVTREMNHFAFVGDSRMRQLFFHFLSLADPEAVPTRIDSQHDRPLEKAHSSLIYNDTNSAFQISFFWVPVFNETAADLLQKLSNGTALKGLSIPKVVVAGAGVWDIKLSFNNTSEGDALNNYASNLISIYKVLNEWPNNDTQLLWKLQDPVDEEKLSPDRQMITNEQIYNYNYAALSVLYTISRKNFQIWHSALQITTYMDTADDGLHVGRIPLNHQFQVLLNMYCNKWMDFDDGTCCRKAESVTILQIISLTLLLLCLLFTLTVLVYRGIRLRRQSQRIVYKEPLPKEAEGVALMNGHATNNRSKENGSAMNQHHRRSASNTFPGAASNWRSSINALGRLGLIMAYFFLCDRTNVFMKENKYYSDLNFWLPILYVFVLGFFFNEESSSTRVLHRDQTDEWKGWMQLVILIYHMTGASQVLPLYMQMRLLVSSYLFLTGYGHFCYFWNGGSGNFSRFCQVLFRMNLMTVVMCLVMNRPYQSYYFVPLVSFSYLVVYIVLALPPRVNAATCASNPVDYFYIVMKFVGLLSAITILYLSEVFFEQIFLMRPWKALFVTRDDEVHEWWFRWSLDRYSVCFGMVFAFVYLNIQKLGLLDDSTNRNLLNSGRSMILATFGALLGLGGYTAFTLTCRSKLECNEFHSYIVFIPIVSYVVLRNIFGPLRTRYSTFFAWFGSISLELFIGQYHAWLAADTHGVLVLIPNYPVLNVCVTTYILACLAHEVHAITAQLVGVAVPSDWKLALRNFILFFLALVPIAIHDGTF